MSLTRAPQGTPSPAPASLSVDELEAKLNALHDYLSTPYRARAEAILQQRRRRERLPLDLSPSSPFRLTAPTSDAMNKERVPVKGLCTSATTTSSDRFNMVAQVPAITARTSITATPAIEAPPHTVTSPAVSLFTDNAARAEQARSSDAHDIASASAALVLSASPKDKETWTNSELHTAERNGRANWRDDMAVCHSGLMAASAQESEFNAVLAQRRIQRLEWQVRILAQALQEERDCVTQLREKVVDPLQALVETSVRRQLELERELANLKGVPLQF